MRRDAQRLNDILEALDWIAKAVTGRTETDFVADETLCYAVAQKLTIVGEAVARLSPELTARHNSVPWPDIVGLRNIRFTSTSASIGRWSGRQRLITPQSCADKSRRSCAPSSSNRRVIFGSSATSRPPTSPACGYDCKIPTLCFPMWRRPGGRQGQRFARAFARCGEANRELLCSYKFGVIPVQECFGSSGDAATRRRLEALRDGHKADPRGKYERRCGEHLA
jgi:hypothetical protein